MFIKVLKYTLIVVLLIILLLWGGLYSLIKLPAVQTRVLSYVTEYIENNYGVKVHIDETDIHFPYYFTFHNVTVYDLKNDTLLHSGKIMAAFQLFDINQPTLSIPYIHLRNASIRLKRYTDDDDLNIIKLLEQFPSSTDTSAGKELLFEKVLLDNVHFSYIDTRYPEYSPVFDGTNIDVTNLYANISNIHFSSDTMMMQIQHLSLQERSGFAIRKMVTNFSLSNTGIGLEKLSLQTTMSLVNGNVKMSFNDWTDFEDFENRVNMYGEFEPGYLSSTDISKFSSYLFHLEQKVDFSGVIKGTVNDLRANNLELHFGNKTQFKGNISIHDIMDLDNSFVDLNIALLSTTADDLRKIQIAPYDQCVYLEVPEIIDNMGLMEFKGKFTGFLHDFVTYGNLSSDLGFLSSDLNLKIDQNNIVTYSGNLAANTFNVGKFFSIEKFMKNTSFNVNVEGRGLSLKTADLEIEGNVAFIDLLDYPYSNITLDGLIKKKQFNGELSIYDPHVGMLFNGLVDFNNEIPTYDFVTNIEYLRPVKTKLIKRDESAEITGKLHLLASGNSFSNFEGVLSVDSLNYSENDKSIFLKQITMEANESVLSQNNFLSVKSDFMDAKIYGRSNAISFYDDFISLLNSYYIPQSSFQKMVTAYSKAEIHIYNVQQISEIFLPELKFINRLDVEVELNKKGNPLSVQISSDSIHYSNLFMRSIDYQLRSDTLGLTQRLFSPSLRLLDSLQFSQLEVIGNTNKFQTAIDFSVFGADSALNRLNIQSHVDHQMPMSVIRLSEIELLMDQILYANNKAGEIFWSGDSIALHNINLNSGVQNITIEGILSNRIDESLRINVDSVQMNFFNKFLGVYGLNTAGTVQGTVELQSLLADLKFNADLTIYDFILNDEKIGNTTIHSRYSDKNKVVVAEVRAEHNKVKTLDVKGEVDLSSKIPQFDFAIMATKLPLATFNKYMVGFASELSGLCSGDLHLYGPSDKIYLTGNIRLQKVRFKIDYLNTYYSFSDEIKLNERNIDLDEIDIFDSYGNKGKASGKIYHTNLDDFIFNLYIDADNLNVLNTTKLENDFFYGTAFASGNAHIYGAIDFLRMRIGVKSERNSEVNFSFSGSSEVSRNSYIRFISNDIDTLQEDLLVANIETEGIDLAMDIEGNENLKVRIVFDEAIGDVMEGRGNGDMRMEIDTKGDVKMYGSYNIDNGSYLFTLQNVINKKFELDKGGVISWEGNPYEAKINMTARYSVRAGLYDLLQDTAAALKRRVPVEVALKLTDDLMTPDINFDINIPDLDPYTESLVTKYLTTDEEINRQVFSLLFARKFSTPPELANSSSVSSQSNAAVENATEFLSNQLSNWVSNISDNFDVGFYYSGGDKISSEELEIALSTQLFNERVIVDGSFGVHNGITSSSNQLIGDFNIQYKLSEDGKVKLKAFNRYNENSLYKYYSSPYTQGIGITYTDEFNTIKELMQRYFSKPREMTMEDSNQ